MYARMQAISRNLEFTGVLHRANYEPMLDRLAGGISAGPLKVVADAVEARGLGQGRSAARITSYTPLNRLVDAARPESELVRSLEQAVKRFLAARLADQQDLTLLRRQFQAWASNDAAFQVLAENNSQLAEVKPISKDLSALGAMGLKAIDYLVDNQPAPPDWLSQQNTELQRMQRPAADVLLAAQRPVRLLIDALARK